MTAFLRQPVNFQAPYDITSLPAHYKQSTTTICACAQVISPIDASIVAFTTWSRNLTGVPGYPGVTFKTTTGMAASNVEVQQGQNAANMEATMFLVAAGITEADALAGRWTHAEAIVFVTNYEALKMGQYITHKGHLGQFVQKGKLLTVEIMGFNNALTQQYGKVTRATCSRRYGDSLCTLDLAGRGEIKTGALTAVASQTVFTDSSRSEADDYFGNGEIQFNTGQNAGLPPFYVDAYDGTLKRFTLRTPTPYLPIIGDTYTAKRGCRKRASDCTDRGNIVNTDLEPFVPTIEDLSRLPLS